MPRGRRSQSDGDALNVGGRVRDDRHGRIASPPLADHLPRDAQRPQRLALAVGQYEGNQLLARHTPSRLPAMLFLTHDTRWKESVLGARFLSVIMELRRLDTPAGYSVRDGAGRFGRSEPPRGEF